MSVPTSRFIPIFRNAQPFQFPDFCETFFLLFFFCSFYLFSFYSSSSCCLTLSQFFIIFSPFVYPSHQIPRDVQIQKTSMFLNHHLTLAPLYRLFFRPPQLFGILVFASSSTPLHIFAFICRPHRALQNILTIFISVPAHVCAMFWHPQAPLRNIVFCIYRIKNLHSWLFPPTRAQPDRNITRSESNRLLLDLQPAGFLSVLEICF